MRATSLSPFSLLGKGDGWADRIGATGFHGCGSNGRGERIRNAVRREGRRRATLIDRHLLIGGGATTETVTACYSR